MPIGQNIILAVDQLRRYDRDPRRDVNPKYQLIKESIREQGITNRLTVTQRPGDDWYIPFSGGNTRIQAIQELWRETGDNRFATIDVAYREWPGEAACIAAHLSENNARGDPSFWDNACGLWDLKSELERGSDRALSSSELAREAKLLGMDFGRGSITTLLFAREQLEPLGPWLTFGAVHKVIKPEILSLQGLCRQLDLPGPDRLQLISVPVVASATLLQARGASHPASTGNEATSERGQSSLDADALVADIRRSVAQALGFSAASLGAALAIRAQHPDLLSAELRVLIDQAMHAIPGVGRRRQDAAVNVAANAAPALAGLLPDDAAPTHPMGAAAAMLDTPGACPAPNLGGTRATAKRSAPSLAQPLGDSTAMAGARAAVEGAPAIHPAALVTTICDLVGLLPLLHLAEGLPLGHFMELPADPIDDRRQQLVWLLLASLSGQCAPSSLTHLPPNSAWRCAIESCVDPDAALRQAMAAAFLADAITPLDLHRCFSDEAVGGLLRQLILRMPRMASDNSPARVASYQ